MEQGPNSGRYAARFALRDDGGTMHRLSELQGDDVMVLMLGRGEHARASECTREQCSSSTSCARSR